MGTPPRPAAQFVAGFAAAAATVTLSGMPAMAAPNPPATLTKDANNPCRVRILEVTTKNNGNFYRIHLIQAVKDGDYRNKTDPLINLSVAYYHDKLVEAQIKDYGTRHGVPIQTEIHRVVPRFDDNNFDPLRSLAKDSPSIMNNSWGAIYPETNDWGKLIKKIDPTYSGKPANLNLSRKYASQLISIITNRQQKTIAIDSESKLWLKNVFSSFEAYHKKGNIIVKSSGNSSDIDAQTYSPLSLPPYVNSVMAAERNGKTSPFSSQGTHAEPGYAFIKAIDDKGTSAILSNGLVLPIQESKASPDSRTASYQQISTPLPPEIQSRLIGATIVKAQTSLAAPILSAKLAVACEAIRSENPNKPAEQLLQETARQVLMQGRGGR